MVTDAVPIRSRRDVRRSLCRRLGLATIFAVLIAVILPLSASASDSQAPVVATPSPPAKGPISWQNPYLAPRENNNIHVDSYSSDTYTIPGPTEARSVQITRAHQIPNPAGGRPLEMGLGGTQTFDAQGHLIILGISRSRLSLNMFDENMNVIASRILTGSGPAIGLGSTPSFRNFAGAYYYLDQNDHPVIAQSNNHIVAYRASPGTATAPGTFEVVRDVDVSGVVPAGEVLYAVMPDKYGTIWFTTHGGLVGTVTLDGRIDTLHLPSGEQITKSISVDEGDGADLPSGVYTPSDFKLYRFEADQSGQITIAWSAPYDRGTFTKPGQVGLGTGTTPTVFRMAGHRYVTINDNATPMHINIYRAEDDIAGQSRLFAQVAPFGHRILVADENSLIAFPTVNGAAILAENNWGYRTPLNASFRFTTQPGFARVDVTPAGAAVTSVNNHISVPSVVSQADVTSGLVYTYEKRTDRWWYLTALHLQDLNSVAFSVRVDESTLLDPLTWNNNYSELSIGNADGAIYVGLIGGVAQIKLS